MVARASFQMPLVVAVGFSVLNLLAMLLWGPTPRATPMGFILSAYFLGDGMGAGIRSMRETFFSRLLPAPSRRIWRQALVVTIVTLTPSVLATASTLGLASGFWLFSLELLALSFGLLLGAWSNRFELRCFALVLLMLLAKALVTSIVPVTSWPLWNQGLSSLLFCVPVVALLVLVLRHSTPLAESKAPRALFAMRKRWFPIARIPRLSPSTNQLASDARWHRWLRLAVFEAGPTPWWLPLLVAPPLFAVLLLMPNFVPGLPEIGSKTWNHLLAFAIGTITVLSVFKGPRLELSLRYPMSRKSQAKVTSTAASVSVLLCLASSLSLLGFLWLAQAGLGLTETPLPMARALVFAILAAAYVTLLQDVRKLGDSSFLLFVFVFYVGIFDWVFSGGAKSGFFAIMLTIAIAAFLLTQLLIWLVPRHTSRHGDLPLRRSDTRLSTR